MLDDRLRGHKDRLLSPLARRLGRVPPNAITLLALLVGLCAAGAAAAGWYASTLGLWLANRTLDGLDGVVAREQRRQSDLGGYIDVVADFVVYAALPIGLHYGQPGQSEAGPLVLLLASFYVNAASWMYLAALLEKRGAGAGVRGEPTSVTMPPGLVGGTETILFYAAFSIWPGALAPLFLAMAAMVAAGVGQRLLWARRHLG
ncbi:MAG: CDP-alcohol phosphatidyltransferase family protein [Vicinamibacteria bacterium]